MARKSAVVGTVFLLLVSCSSGGGRTSAASGTVRGSITVFAAASLTESFNNEKTTLETEQPDLNITYNFAGSATLTTQIQQGAPADVVATADKASMQKLVDAGLVESPTVFARNRLAIIVAPNNPKGIHSLSDLARSDVKVVLCDPSVPVGKYAAQALTTASVAVSPKSLETDVKSAVARVTTGEADAAIVYTTDVTAAGNKASGVTIPDAQNVIAEYPIALVKATKHKDAAQAFIDIVLAGSGRDALRTAGFMT